MLWLEMSRDPVHGGGEWDFGKCLWSPARKPDGSKWAFWETTFMVQADDNVLHLRDKGKEAAFVGFSVASSDGYVSTERPPSPGQWNYSKKFYRVFLEDYVMFATPINLTNVFKNNDDRLRQYFLANKKKSWREKRRLFYVIQSGKLQCLNGAYLSEVDEELADILLQNYDADPDLGSHNRAVARKVSTGEQLKKLKVRLGQALFCEAVRNNYGHTCCFPGCEIQDDRFLVAGHISRWVDNTELRGEISNGICLCLLHDKAFEIGLFTITLDRRVWINRPKIRRGSWAERNLLPYNGVAIAIRNTPPSEIALRGHWARHGILL